MTTVSVSLSNISLISLKFSSFILKCEFKTKILFTLSVANCVRLDDIKLLAEEKHRSDEALVAGIHARAKKTLESFGNIPLRSVQYFIMSLHSGFSFSTK